MTRAGTCAVCKMAFTFEPTGGLFKTCPAHRHNTCEYCDKPYTRKVIQQRFCSKSCAALALRKRPPIATVTPEMLIADLKRVHALVGKASLPKEAYIKHGVHHARTVEKKFGSWNHGLDAALIPRFIKGVKQEKWHKYQDLDLAPEVTRQCNFPDCTNLVTSRIGKRRCPECDNRIKWKMDFNWDYIECA